MQFKLYTLLHIGRNRVAIALLSAFVGQFRQIVGLELDTIQLVVATQLFDFLLTFFWR